jgi:hypothetical protein
MLRVYTALAEGAVEADIQAIKRAMKRRQTLHAHSPSHGRRSPLRYNTVRLQNPVLIGLIQVNRDSLAVAARWSKIAPDL